MESPASLHGRCAPWHIGTGNRRQICDFEVQPAPHDQMPRWVQEHSPTFKSTCPASMQNFISSIQQPQLQQQLPLTQQQQQQYFRSQMLPCQQQQQQHQLQQQQQIQRLFGDDMLLSDFEQMDGMERRFYVPPQFRNAQNLSQGDKNGVVKKDLTPRPSTNRRECRSMCMPKGMGAIDPNCQGEDYRVKSGYQPSRPGDAVDRRFDPCCKWRPFRDGTSEGHKANHWQFGSDKASGAGAGKGKAGDCETNACPEKETTIGNRSVYPKLGGMVPGYGGHVPGFERCKFGKTYGRETAEVLRKVNSTEKIPKSYKMAEWRNKCYNREVNC